jgi:hypothetical protein
VRIEVYSAYKRNCGFRSGIDKPALLVLAKPNPCPIPPYPNASAALLKPLEMIRGPPEGIAFPLFSLRVWSLTDHPDIKAACCSTPQYVQRSSEATGHFEGCPHKRHRDPDASAGLINCLANAPKRRITVDQRV